jgi:uncharacterized protein involved in outer membrane biogenesis
VASGTLTNPFQLRVFDLQFALSGQDLADLYPLLGIAIPPSPPYALTDGSSATTTSGATSSSPARSATATSVATCSSRWDAPSAADRHAGIQAPGLR